MDIVIHTKVGCPYCEDAKQFFNKRKMPFREVIYDPSKPRDYEQRKNALIQKTKHITFPQIFINGKFIGGYSDLLQVAKQNRW